jgi:hypothetical protein
MRPRTRGSGSAVVGEPRAHSADRGEGAAEAEAPVAEPEDAELFGSVTSAERSDAGELAAARAARRERAVRPAGPLKPSPLDVTGFTSVTSARRHESSRGAADTRGSQSARPW